MHVGHDVLQNELKFLLAEVAVLTCLPLICTNYKCNSFSELLTFIYVLIFV